MPAVAAQRVQDRDPPLQLRDDIGAERDLGGRLHHVDLHEARGFGGYRQAVEDTRDRAIPLGRNPDAVGVYRGQPVGCLAERRGEAGAALVLLQACREGAGRGARSAAA